MWRSLPFLLLFPGFFVYQWGVLNGWMPLFAGGYVNEASSVICAGFILALATRLLTGQRIAFRWTTIDTCFAVFISWFAGVVFVNAVLLTAPGVTKNHVASWLQLLACYLATRFVAIQEIRKLLLFLVCVLSVSVLWAFQSEQLEQLTAFSQQKGIATYQDLARAYLVTAAFGLAIVYRRIFRWLGYLVTVFVLFLIGARSEIVGSIILFVVMEISISRRPATIALGMAVAAALSIVLALSASDFFLDLFPGNRLLLLLLEGKEDMSVVERDINLGLAWNAILDSPLFGDYGHYEKVASAGSYAHNWFSVWVDLGVVGLVLFISVYVLAVRQVFATRLRVFDLVSEGMQSLIGLSIGWLVMMVILILFAKHFADNGTAILVGLIASIWQQNIAKSNSRIIDVPFARTK